MSYASKARKKAKRREEDAKDPERQTIRNGIRRGVIPKLTQVTQVGHYVDEQGNKTGKTFEVKRRISSFGMIIEAHKYGKHTKS